MTKYLKSESGNLFRLDVDGMEDIFTYLLKYSHENDFNVAPILKEINDHVNKQKKIHKTFRNQNDEIILRNYKTDGSLANELIKNGYVVRFSRQRRSCSVYIKNDDMELIRISDHFIPQYIDNKGLMTKRFDEQVIFPNRLVNYRELEKYKIFINRGDYELD